MFQIHTRIQAFQRRRVTTPVGQHQKCLSNNYDQHAMN